MTSELWVWILQAFYKLAVQSASGPYLYLGSSFDEKVETQPEFPKVPATNTDSWVYHKPKVLAPSSGMGSWGITPSFWSPQKT